eukprot:759621-Pleurochrysis_carterae.AAC.1
MHVYPMHVYPVHVYPMHVYSMHVHSMHVYPVHACKSEEARTCASVCACARERERAQGAEAQTRSKAGKRAMDEIVWWVRQGEWKWLGGDCGRGKLNEVLREGRSA